MGSGSLFCTPRWKSWTWTISYVPINPSGNCAVQSWICTETLEGSHSFGGHWERFMSKPSIWAEGGRFRARSTSHILDIPISQLFNKREGQVYPVATPISATRSPSAFVGILGCNEKSWSFQRKYCKFCLYWLDIIRMRTRKVDIPDVGWIASGENIIISMTRNHTVLRTWGSRRLLFLCVFGFWSKRQRLHSGTKVPQGKHLGDFVHDMNCIVEYVINKEREKCGSSKLARRGPFHLRGLRDCKVGIIDKQGGT